MKFTSTKRFPPQSRGKLPPGYEALSSCHYNVKSTDASGTATHISEVNLPNFYVCTAQNSASGTSGVQCTEQTSAGMLDAGC